MGWLTGWDSIVDFFVSRSITRESEDGATDNNLLISLPLPPISPSPSLPHLPQCLVLLKIKTRTNSSQPKYSAICAMLLSSVLRLYIRRVSAVRTFLALSRPILILLSSHTTYTCALCGLFVQLPDSDKSYSRIRGPCDGL